MKYATCTSAVSTSADHSTLQQSHLLNRINSTRVGHTSTHTTEIRPVRNQCCAVSTHTRTTLSIYDDSLPFEFDQFLLNQSRHFDFANKLATFGKH